MRRYRHVAFDFDGVLCDSLSAAMAVFNQLREESFPALPEVADREDMVKVYGGPLRTSLSAWLTPAEQRRFFDLHSAAMAKRAGELQAFEGIDGMFVELPPRSASIITSAYSEAVAQVLVGGDGDLPPSLFEIVGRERRQTKTQKLAELTERLGIDAAECLYVGDLESDVIYCRAVPMDIVAVTYGYHPRSHLEQSGATSLADSVDELCRLISEVLDDRLLTA